MSGATKQLKHKYPKVASQEPEKVAESELQNLKETGLSSDIDSELDPENTSYI